MWTLESKNIELVKDAENETAKLTVETTDNHIYFYADVDSDRCLALIKSVRELDKTLRNERLSRNLPDEYPAIPIWLHIYSGGGSLFSGLSIADQLKTIATPVFSIVEGYCASAATLISMACTKRYIMPSAFMLIHQLSAFAWGTFEQIKDEVHLLGMAMDRLTNFYSEHSNLEGEEIKEMLRHDSWFMSQECLERGFVDEILGK